jgi:hypothetical protein
MGEAARAVCWLSWRAGVISAAAKLVAVLWQDQPDSVGSGTFNTVLWRLPKLA